MLTEAQRDRLNVILVSPRNPLNIGAAARAMANFGFQRLSIVAPFAQNWMDAKSAVGAPDLLRDAQVFATLAEAVAPATLVLGTGSLDRRRPEQAILDLPQAAVRIRATLNEESGSGLRPGRAASSRVALLFGSEKHGLTSDDLSWCHALAVIDTADAQPSMNLGQAVAVCLYEISRMPENESGSPSHDSTRKLKNAEDTQAQPSSSQLSSIQLSSSQPSSSQLDRLAELIEETMAAVNYATRGMRSANGEAMRVLLRRLMPNDADLRRMMGLFRRILWQLRRPGNKL